MRRKEKSQNRHENSNLHKSQNHKNQNFKFKKFKFDYYDDDYDDPLNMDEYIIKNHQPTRRDQLNAK